MIDYLKILFRRTVVKLRLRFRHIGPIKLVNRAISDHFGVTFMGSTTFGNLIVVSVVDVTKKGDGEIRGVRDEKGNLYTLTQTVKDEDVISYMFSAVDYVGGVNTVYLDYKPGTSFWMTAAEFEGVKSIDKDPNIDSALANIVTAKSIK